MSLSNSNVQSLFLKQLMEKLPSNLSFAEELAEVLHISRDSAYRRIRGETVLSLEEVKTICSHYNLTLDSLLAPTKDQISFHHRVINETDFTFAHWLKSIVGNLEMIRQFPQKQLVYCAKDVPIFHYFKFHELAAFKMYFWMKVYLRYSQYKNIQFDPAVIPHEYFGAGEKAWTLYADIPSIEIWSEETFNITTRQINYSLESGFISPSQAAQLKDQLLNLAHDIKTFAAAGKKGNDKARFELYKNEILIADTTILFKMADKQVAFITYNTMNILTTSQEAFCRSMDNYIKNIIDKSVLISEASEKERNKFFNSIQKSIEEGF